MKKTSPWFILLFPIAIPAMILLDYLGYRIISLLILIALVLTFVYYVYSLFTKFRSLRCAFSNLAETLCDPGSWSVRHYPYHHTLSGSVAGRRFHFSLLGHDERALCQLFLECPVSKNFIVEAGDAAAQPVQDLPQDFGAIRQLPGFRNLRALSRRVPFFIRLLGGLAGSGGPGLVLRKQVDDPLCPPDLKRDLELLHRLAALLDEGPPERKDH
jgi:hypothetical protein